MPASVVLASRLQDADVAAARVALRLAAALPGDLVVVYVAKELETATSVAASAGLEEQGVREQMLREAEARARAFAERHLAAGAAQVRVAEGGVVEEIARAAAGADFLVIGSTRGDSPLLELVAGSTAHELIRHAPCPVVVVPLD